jgi:hypothetical protein
MFHQSAVHTEDNGWPRRMMLDGDRNASTGGANGLARMQSL